MRRFLLLTAWLALTLSAAPAEAAVFSVRVDGVAQNVLIETPSGSPRAVVVMFPGGDGVIGIGADGHIAHPGNFLIRTRAAWLAKGFVYVAVDAPPARARLPHDRVGYDNQRAIAAIVAKLRARTKLPIWLLGTSAGAPAALAGAATLPAGSIAGVVISSPVSLSGPRDSVFDANLLAVRVPVLIEVADGDACRLSPPANAAVIKHDLRHARLVEIERFPGGALRPGASPCGPFSPHGFFGIEGPVIDAAAQWIAAHSAP